MTDQTSSRSTNDLKEIEAEALIRFAVEFLYRVMGSPRSDAQAAYHQTLPDDLEYQEVSDYMWELVHERARYEFATEFREWAQGKILPLHAADEHADQIKALKAELSKLNPTKDQEEYNKLFGDLVDLERRRRKLLKDLGEEPAA